MTTKSFPTLAVVGAWSGFLLEERGFGGIHEVFDHLYPGIMTLGIAAMSDNAAAWLTAHVPALAKLPKVTGENWREVAATAVDLLGPTLDVPGPATVEPSTIRDAFTAFGKAVGR